MKLFLSRIPAISRQISGASRVQSFCTCLSLCYFVLTRSLLGWRRLYPVTLRHDAFTFTLYIYDLIDIEIIGEIYTELFISKEYEWALPFEVNTVVDLGAHFGDTPLYYHAVYPRAAIVAVEPLPENVTRMKRSLRNHAAVTIIEGAAGASDTVADLHLTPSTFGTSLIRREKSRASIQVPVYSLETIFNRAEAGKPVDLIKFDIEGGEFALFKSIDPAEYAKAYIGEIHVDFFKDVSIEDFRSYFRDFSYTLTPQETPGRYMIRAVHKQYI